MPPLNQYLKRVEIPLELLMSMFANGFSGEGFHVIEGIPAGAKLQSAYVNSNNVVLILEHSDFPVVETGTIVPKIEVKIGDLPRALKDVDARTVPNAEPEPVPMSKRVSSTKMEKEK